MTLAFDTSGSRTFFMSSGFAFFRGTIWVTTRSLGPIASALQPRLDVLFPCLLTGDDLDHVSRWDRRQAVDLEDGFENPVGLVGGDLARRKDTDLSLDRFIDDEVLARDLADELDEGENVDVVEIDRDVFPQLSSGGPGLPGSCGRCGGRDLANIFIFPRVLPGRCLCHVLRRRFLGRFFLDGGLFLGSRGRRFVRMWRRPLRGKTPLSMSSRRVGHCRQASPPGPFPAKQTTAQTRPGPSGW